MKYRNAAELLPEELLKEVQKYAGGELLYVPNATERKEWGSASGAKSYYRERNEEIRRKYHTERKSLAALAEEYGLSTETVRRLLYK